MQHTILPAGSRQVCIARCAKKKHSATKCGALAGLQSGAKAGKHAGRASCPSCLPANVCSCNAARSLKNHYSLTTWHWSLQTCMPGSSVAAVGEGYQRPQAQMSSLAMVIELAMRHGKDRQGASSPSLQALVQTSRQAKPTANPAKLLSVPGSRASCFA